jgi:hypothetical protein
VSASEPGRPRRRPRSRPATGRPAPVRPAPVRLATRLVVAQAAAAAAVGLAFSRRHLPSVLITLALMVSLCLLALLVRSGTRAAWLTAVTLESVFFAYGVSRFVFARYVGGTLFALVVAGTLLHPAVARAYSAVPGTLPGHDRGEVGFGDATGETFGEHAAS